MKKVQTQLKQCLDRQSSSMTGLIKLSEQLGTSSGETPLEPQQILDNINKTTSSNNANDNNNMIIEGEEEAGVADALETTTASVENTKTSSSSASNLKGENKAPRRKARGGRKYNYMLKAKGKPREEKKEKPRPKFFCQF